MPNQIIFNWVVIAWMVILSIAVIQHRDALIGEIDATTRIIEIIKDYHYQENLDNDTKR